MDGFYRRIDSLGRISIPREMRQCLRVCEGDKLSMEVKDNSLILRKKEETRSFSEEFNRFTMLLAREEFQGKREVLESLNKIVEKLEEENV